MDIHFKSLVKECMWNRKEIERIGTIFKRNVNIIHIRKAQIRRSGSPRGLSKREIAVMVATIIILPSQLNLGSKKIN